MKIHKKHLFTIQDSGMFDEDWYLSKYPDVRAAGLHPIIHYLKYGELLGRDPNPNFSTRFYLEEYPDVAESGVNPFLHYITFGMRERRASSGRSGKETVFAQGIEQGSVFSIPPLLKSERLDIQNKKGAIKSVRFAPTIMACAHVAGNNLYGGERSFIDIVEGLSSVGYNVLTIVPKHDNSAYLETLLQYSTRLISFNYSWWRKNHQMDELVVATFERIIRSFSVDAVHTNTIMLLEPRIAAIRSGIPACTHVREIIEHDKALVDFIGNTPSKIIEEVKNQSSYIIANSLTTANMMGDMSRTFIVENCIDTDKLRFSGQGNRDTINIGLISSNLPKKGIYDFVQIATNLVNEYPHVKFLMIGPENSHVKQLQKQQEDGKLPTNIYFPGYFIEIAEVYELTDIILNLSHFQESFGRTVLEGMTAGKPVIAYDWGAVAELIKHEETGFLVPFKDTDEVTRRLRQLCEDPNLMLQMGKRGRQIAVKNYSKAAYAAKLESAYKSIGLIVNASSKPLTDHKVSVVIPNYNYAQFLTERIWSVLRQTIAPYEVIFLDDNSSDESISLARELLENSGVSFRVFQNYENLGTYEQWKKGIEEARGNFIWIAEADDSCDPEFLEKMLSAMDDKGTVISYCQSLVIDENNEVIRSRNLHHTDELSQTRWLKNYKETGLREVIDYLLYRNTIPNVSACLFRTDQLRLASATLGEFQYCGDWLLYCLLLKQGNVAFNALPLNIFRRHSGSVTRSQGKSLNYFRELVRIKQEQLDQFPVHSRQIPEIKKFINSDYRFDGLDKNTEWSEFKEFIDGAEGRIAYRRRFVMLTTNNGSFNGGSEMLWIESAMALRGKGHDVMVVIRDWDPPPPFFDTFFQLGIKICFKGENEVQVIRKFEPDLIMVSTGDQDEGTEYFEVFMEYGLPYIIVNQLTKQVEYWPLREKKLPDVRAAYKNAVKTFFTCSNNHLVMESRLGNEIVNAERHYNPYHIDRNTSIPFPPVGQGAQIAMPAKLLQIHKGQRTVIELMSLERWKNSEVTINLYGEGPDEEEFKQLVAEKHLTNIRFHPRVPDLLTIWRTNHAILMASFMEGLPIVLVSAMLSSRVPILTDIGGHAEVIDDNRSGFLARRPTVEDLNEALERAIARFEDWEEIGRLARKQILEFLPEDPVTDFVNKLESCCKATDFSTSQQSRVPA
jgi:glycosyltransferase involved in cell wall biosynthesis